MLPGLHTTCPLTASHLQHNPLLVPPPDDELEELLDEELEDELELEELLEDVVHVF